jgi:hypothetical protein
MNGMPAGERGEFSVVFCSDCGLNGRADVYAGRVDDGCVLGGVVCAGTGADSRVGTGAGALVTISSLISE